MPQRILVVDDDDLLRRSLIFLLEGAGFQTAMAATAEAGLALARTDPPNLVLLDINLPGMDGLQALRHFRDELGLPVIFLTARRREIDEILGLELGANDYITKPFDKDVLIARVRATLRQALAERSPQTPPPLTVGDLTIDPAGHTLTIGDEPINLTPREFRLLHELASRPGQVLAADELLDRVWGSEYAGEAQIVYVHINSLRKKVEANPDKPQRIVTVRGIGYKLLAKTPFEA